MIIVIRRADKPERQHAPRPRAPRPRAPRPRAPGLRGHIAALVAVAALAVAAAAWFWATRQPTQAEADLALSQRIIVVGCGAFVAALIAEIRAMSFSDVVEAAWDLFVGLVLGLLALIGAILRAIWNAILSLLGLD